MSICGSSSPTAGNESWLMVLLVSVPQSLLECHTEVCWVLFCSSFIPVKCLSWWRTDYMHMMMTPRYWQLFASQQTDLLLLPPLTGTWPSQGLGGLLLNVIFSFSSARCIRWPVFALIRPSCRCVIDVMLLHCLCCTKLIRTRVIVCSVIFHLLLSEFDIHKLRLQLYQGVERPNLQEVSCRPRLVCGVTFPTLCLTPERQMSFNMEQSIVESFG